MSDKPAKAATNVVRFPKSKHLSRNAISKSFVEGIGATGQQQMFRDSKLIGFGLRVSSNGKKTYVVEGRIRGAKQSSAKRITIGDASKITNKQARVEAVRLLAEMQQGTDPVEKQRIELNQNITLANLLTLFIDSRDLKSRTKTDYRADIETNFNMYLNRPVRAMNAEMIRDWYLAGRNKPTTTDRAYRVLKSVLQYAVGMQVIENNPAQAVTDMGIRYRANKRTTFLEFNEIGLFLNAILELTQNNDINTTIRDWLILILSTGLRDKESKSLKWEDVNLEAKSFTIRDTKNRRDLTLPMTSTLYCMFKTRRDLNQNNDEYVFPNRFGGKPLAEHRKTLSKVIQRAGIHHKSSHDFRRTLATVCEFLQINDNIISVILNHTKQDITQQYIQIQRPAIFDALRRVENFLDEKIPIPHGNDITLGTGILRHVLYNHPEQPDIQDPSDHRNLDEIDERTEREYWGED